MKNIIIKVEGMKCSGCESRIEKVISNLKEVKSVKANYEKGTVEVTLLEDYHSNIIKEKIETLGFSVIGEEL